MRLPFKEVQRLIRITEYEQRSLFLYETTHFTSVWGSQQTLSDMTCRGVWSNNRNPSLSCIMGSAVSPVYCLWIWYISNWKSASTFILTILLESNCGKSPNITELILKLKAQVLLDLESCYFTCMFLHFVSVNMNMPIFLYYL